jgi:hypothetical protein
MSAKSKAVRSAVQPSWAEANQAFLVAEFARLREQMERRNSERPQTKSKAKSGDALRRAQQTLERLNTPAAIDQLAALFALSPFERDILLLCAGVEMDSALAAQCTDGLGHAGGHAQRPAPTFGFALSTLTHPHWSALTPSRPLRRYRLIEIDSNHGLTTGALRIDERILHFIAGINLLDPRLDTLLEPTPPRAWIANEHQALAEEIAAVFTNAPDRPHDRPPILHLCGDDAHGQQDTAAHAAAEAGCQLFRIRAEDIPTAGADLDQILLLWTRESGLLNAVLLIECGTTGLTPSARHILERLPGHVIVSSREPFQISRSLLRYEVNKPQAAEQKRLWQEALGPAAQTLDGFLDNIAEQFRLSARTIHTTGSVNSAAQPAALWKTCRALARPRIEELAQRIAPCATWDDLILPEIQKQTLHRIAAQVSCRMKVYESWGFSAKNRRGLGISALFSGESGTGKTLAAEVLAAELGLDLYRIDLSAVVSKYIGETEKNLRQVFDAAEEGGVLLLFDEADALFGKRGDVKDSHDRYSNIEVGYLLQRMEAYQGLAILTTNLKSSIDRAFQRRLRFIVTFPFPDAEQREAIWSRAFPTATPTTGLSPAALAQLKVPGGNIRNIALNAAFLAAAATQPVDMSHLLEAARLEALKIERPLSDAETRGWI